MATPDPRGERVARVRDREVRRRTSAWTVLAAVVAFALCGAVAAVWLCRPRFHMYDPALLAAVRVGMTRAEVEAAAGRPLSPPDGREVGARSSRPTRLPNPDLIQEDGLTLTFDDADVLTNVKGWCSVRKEHAYEWLLRQVGIDPLKHDLPR
jgi:outer membrane protein assembly factor BamE (lipoprotein component of BamABCDE complex)